MSTFLAKNSRKRMTVWAVLYLLAYLLASYLDLGTTALALRRPEVHERNVFAVNAQGYVATRAWFITVIGGVAMEAFVLFGVRYAARVDGIWLQRPIRSFAKFYINPWSESVIDRSPLHMLSFALAFVVLRVLAAINNLLLYEYGFGPLGALVGAVGARTSPLVGFCLVIALVFYLLAMALSSFAAKLISSWRTGV